MSAKPPLRVAFATYHGIPEITPDDLPIRDALTSLGVDLDGVRWDSDAEWGRYDVVLPRSTWDYHLRLPEFDAWLGRVNATGARLINPLAVLRWNMTKRYLAELEARGVCVVPTAWVAPISSGRAPLLAEIAAGHGWHGVVVIKPVVSASATDTWISSARTPKDERRFQASLSRADEGLMVQPFLPEIERDGEWSLICIAGRFSHAVVKRPAAGDFRVQLEHGGFHESLTPPASLIDDAERVVEAAARSTGVEVADILYARIDGIAREGRLLLMECEVLEPALHLSTSPTAASSLAAGIHAIAVRARRS